METVRAVFILLSLLTLQTHVQCISQQIDVELEIDKEFTLQTPGYPLVSPPPDSTILWSVTSPKYSRITIYCEDVRISPSDECKQGYLVISHSEGRSAHYCGSEHGIEISTTDNYMAVTFTLKWAQGLVSCKARAIKIVNSAAFDNDEPSNTKKVFIKPGEAYAEIDLRPIPIGETLNWEFTTEEDYKIGIRCPTLWFQDSSTNSSCQSGKLTINLGGKTDEVLCGNIQTQPTFISERNESSISLHQVNIHTIGFVVCVVIATKGPHFEPWLNADVGWTFGADGEIPRDSSEDGNINIPGTKNTTCACGWSNKSRKRILNGEDADPNEFPWMASLKIGGIYGCGATIITEYHVLSATHCLLKYEVNDISVLVGTNNLERPEEGQTIPAKQIFHHNYQPFSAPKNDISLIVLEHKIQFSKFVGPACIPAYEPVNLYSSQLKIMGWGLLTPEEMLYKSKNILKKANMQAIQMKLCNIAHDLRYDTKPETQICAWSPTSDVCFGDSGGPVVWLDPDTNRYTLVGIPAVCDGCKLEKPSIHTAVHFYYAWIQEMIKSSYHSDSKMCIKVD